jgi:hypothetical protein
MTEHPQDTTGSSDLAGVALLVALGVVVAVSSFLNKPNSAPQPDGQQSAKEQSAHEEPPAKEGWSEKELREHFLTKAKATLGADLRAAAEEVVFDEVDLFDHPRYMGSAYRSAFEPARVRPRGASYFARSAPQPRGGRTRFGEVALEGTSGSVLYLPRALDYDEARGVSFRYRKHDPKGRVVFSLWLSPTNRASAREGETEGFPLFADTEWHEVRLSLGALRLREPLSYPEKPKHLDRADALRYAPAVRGRVFGLEVGLEDAKAKTSLDFDRLSLLHAKATDRGIVHGSVDPPLVGLEIVVRTPRARLSGVTDERGRFRIKLPEGTTRFEALTRHRGVWYLPTAGRYVEVGTYLPPLRFELVNEKPGAYAVNRVRYSYAHDPERGPIYKPNASLIWGDTMLGRPQQFCVERFSNGFGYQDRDRRYENPDGAYRVVVMGSCYFDSQHTNTQELFSNQLESMFRFAQERPVEVIQVSHSYHLGSGIWPAMEKHAFRLRPQVVIFSMVSPYLLAVTPPENAARIRQFDPEHPQFHLFDLDETTKGLVSKNAASDWELHRLNAPSADVPEARLDYWDKWLTAVNDSGKPALVKRAYRLWSKLLEKLVRECKKRDVELVIAYTSGLGTVERDRSVKDGLECDPALFLERTRRLTVDSGATFVNAMSLIERETSWERRGDNWIHEWPSYGHWTPVGQRLVAEALFEFLESRVASFRQSK